MANVRLIEYAEMIDKQKGRRNNLHKMIAVLKRWGENPRMQSLTPGWFDKLQDRIKEENLSGSTQDGYIATLRTLFRFAVRDGIMIINPSVGVPHITYNEATKDFLSKEEIQILIDTKLGGTLGSEVKRAFLFCCFTGFRVSDVKRLTWDMYDEPLHRISHIQKKTGKAVYIFYQLLYII